MRGDMIGVAGGCTFTQPPSAPTVRALVLSTALELTSGDRDGDYGPPTHNLHCAGRLKEVLRQCATRTLTPGEAEAIDQVLTKVARIVTGPKVKRDNYVDGAAYFAIAYECAEAGK